MTVAKSLIPAGLALALCAGCTGPNAETKTDALLGSGLGAAAGAIIAHDDLEGAAIGGLAGAAIGGIIGHDRERDR